ncbi:MAG: hypothetical protein IKF39_01095 [Oscillospiraceae bacterium]|nr:hypothetical protein [Oscillospiraceae bacterium]
MNIGGITDFISIESMEKTIGKVLEVEEIGHSISGTRKFIFYKDKEGNGWYRTQIKTPSGWKDEEEAIFGNRKKGRYPYKRGAPAGSDRSDM